MMIFWAQSDCMQIWQSTGVYRLQRFSFSIEFSWMFFTLRSGAEFFFCLFSVSVLIFPISMHWKGDTTKHIQRELNLVIVRAFDVSRLQGLTNPKNIISSQAFRLFNIICLSLNHISSRRSYDFLFFLIYQQNIQLHDLRRLKATVILSPKVKSIVYIMNAFTHNESDIILQDLHAFAAASNSLCAIFLFV